MARWAERSPMMASGKTNSWISPGGEGDPRPDERDGLDDGVHHPEAGARQEVVGQGVAGEALEHDRQQEEQTDDPVEFTGAAEGTGEEDAAQMEGDGGHEDDRGPVVDLPHDQAGPHVEGDVEDRLVGRRHALAVERLVDAVVDHRRLRR
jgi:hypothetical protein